MKLIIAPDKFKNSLTGLEFCAAVETGIREIIPKVNIIKLPLADGGDGTIEVVNYYLKGEVIHVTVNNPFFKPVSASYLFAKSSKTAFIEMAEASGVKLLKPEALDCKNATTFGTGELILDAINRGALNIILGIGGSATNDCGIGMATALGYRFLDNDNKAVKPTGANLSHIKVIDASHVHPKLNEVNFNIACDVNNPLYGENGAAYVYAKQKGATPKDIEMLDKGLQDFSKLIVSKFGVNPQLIKGAGAAGGMGIASKVFLNGRLENGIQLIKDLAEFDSKLSTADWVITGEGRLDYQTLSGKTIMGVINSAKSKNVKVAVFCGAIALEQNKIKALGILHADKVDNYAENKADAITNGFTYVMQMARGFAQAYLVYK